MGAGWCQSACSPACLREPDGTTLSHLPPIPLCMHSLASALADYSPPLCHISHWWSLPGMTWTTAARDGWHSSVGTSVLGTSPAHAHAPAAPSVRRRGRVLGDCATDAPAACSDSDRRELSMRSVLTRSLPLPLTIVPRRLGSEVVRPSSAAYLLETLTAFRGCDGECPDSVQAHLVVLWQREFTLPRKSKLTVPVLTVHWDGCNLTGIRSVCRACATAAAGRGTVRKS